MSVAAAIAGKSHNVLDAHATRKESHCQKEAYDEHGDQHEDPCYGFETSVAQSLEDTSAETSNDQPPENRVEAAGQ